MIPIRDSQHLRRILAHLRETNGMTRRILADRLFVTPKTIQNRERGTYGWDMDSTVDAAHMFGYELVLIPYRPPARHYTGTGWPA
jgi:DNA-binding XRE family transcriptional regulator